MFLPDFLQFEAFNQLRREMGAEELGDFVFFDPKRHVTGLERLSLGREGLEVSVNELRVLNDFTLAYKDCRVLLYQAETGQRASGVEASTNATYHLAECPAVVSLRSVDSDFLSANAWRVRGNGEALAESGSVCRQCLQRMRYQNFDAVRQRHREYSERVEQDFDPQAFFKQYPSYPLHEAESVPIF